VPHEADAAEVDAPEKDRRGVRPSSCCITAIAADDEVRAFLGSIATLSPIPFWALQSTETATNPSLAQARPG